MATADVRMWVPLGGGAVRLAPADSASSGGGIEMATAEARWLVVVLALLTGRTSPVTDLRRSLTIALVRRNGDHDD